MQTDVGVDSQHQFMFLVHRSMVRFSHQKQFMENLKALNVDPIGVAGAQ